MSTELCILAEKYRVDKCPSIKHNYTPSYFTILNSIRESAQLIVEIGIGYYEMMSDCCGSDYKAGASLRMWKEFFPSATIVGCDIREGIFFKEPRIQCKYVDQSNGDSLNALATNLKKTFSSADLILDDGSHVVAHMTLSFLKLWHFVKPGGFYIIEDISTDIPYFENLPKEFGFTDCEFYTSHVSEISGQIFVCYKKKSA